MGTLALFCRLGQPSGGELAQFVVEPRQQLGRGLRIAGLGGVEELRKVVLEAGVAESRD
jgi:hypothetical protein